MKTFSFKLNKNGMAETNVPEKYFFEIKNYSNFELSNTRNRYSIHFYKFD